MKDKSLANGGANVPKMKMALKYCGLLILHKKGESIINCIGNVAVTDRRVAFNQQINAIVPKQDDVLYLYWLMLLSMLEISGTEGYQMLKKTSKQKF